MKRYVNTKKIYLKYVLKFIQRCYFVLPVVVVGIAVMGVTSAFVIVIIVVVVVVVVVVIILGVRTFTTGGRVNDC